MLPDASSMTRHRKTLHRVLVGFVALIFAWGLHAQASRDSASRNPDETLVQSTNREAREFVEAGNRLLVRHAALEAEFARGSAAIDKACLARRSADGSAASAAKGSTAPAKALGVNPLAERAAQLEATLERARSDLAEQGKRRCSGGFRLPGQRSDACLVLDMATEWGNQAQSFFLRHRDTANRIDLLAQELARLEERGCLGAQLRDAVQDQQALLQGHVSRESAALLEATIERLKALGSSVR